MVSETIRSFSQFPPSVYRRSFAATKIQRAFRRYLGRKLRKAIRAEQYSAAIIIQRAARRKLIRIRSAKNEAAFAIQKAWRRRLFIRTALMRNYLHPNQIRMYLSQAYKGTSPLCHSYPKKMETLAYL